MAKSGSIMKKTAICAVAALMVGSFTAAQLLSFGDKGGKASSASASAGETITDVTGQVASKFTESLDKDVVKELPSGIGADREISVIVRTTDATLVSAFDAQNGVSRYGSVSAFADSAAGEAVVSRIERANNNALSRLKKAGVNFTLGSTYNTVLGGFEVVTTGGEYGKIVAALDGTTARPYIGEEYAPQEAQLVENDVNVYDTGIFDSSDSAYKGGGTLIAVLDTGFDYTHSVFDPDVFRKDVAENDLSLALKREDLDGKVGGLEAAKYTRGLSPEKVYINEKIPYAYDYADKDTDVYPLDSEHGTHVSGIILGNNVGSTKNGTDDPTIVGVAPYAQLAAMKVFSDTSQGAKQSWIIAALEDCVKLGVDVINMSLGMSAGFTTADEEDQNEVYESVRTAGISLVAAASNDYNSTFGSAKNGNLGLTSNPDSATVGTPSTYPSALSVASISGVKTSYIKYGKRIIYFNEASDAASEPKHFVDDLLSKYGVDSMEFEYVTIPGIGVYADYSGIDVEGKIALVRRGTNTFEEKARVAIEDLHAAGVIIYNNVSGDISMTVGSTDGAVCSISQDDGEVLARQRTGKITISREQVAGPFISDFSSWGPTPDLRIKPEITAHGGDILSAVPGQRYDRLSGTSMASPNQAGVSAIIRGYVKDNPEKFNLSGSDDATRREVNARVNQLLMSTADIAYNNTGLPYAVRKQGAGLANLIEALNTPAYITTYERNDENLYGSPSRFLVDDAHIMDKAKIEYGDDRYRTGIYDLVFTINNFSNTALTYKIGALVETEGVSETLTVRGDTTVTEKGYALSPKVSVTYVNDTPHKGDSVTVSANGKATVTVRIQLSDSDKQYLEQSFKYGMYVEGFITLDAKSGTKVGLNVPFLAFYGDWTEAPIYDLDYFETNPDELDNGIDPDDKTLPDAYATQPIGSMYDDYIMYLGSYPFLQDPTATPVAASREHIALTNQQNENGVNGLYEVWAGMLRASKRVDITITDSTTGEVIWSKTETNIRKTYSSGTTFVNSTVELGFSVPEHDLKNNTKYLVRLESYLDYGKPEDQHNVKNVFEFPFTTDFLAPVVTNVEFYTEVDRTNIDAPKTRTYARLSIFDNHYAAGAFFGYFKYAGEDSEYLYEMPAFSNYATVISASSANTTTDVVFELTDYVDDMRDAVHPNTFTVQIFDYALNISTFEIKIPDEVIKVNFPAGDKVSTDENGEQTISINPNEKFILSPEVYPSSEWASTLTYEIGDEDVARVVGGTLLGVQSGDTTMTVYSMTEGNKKPIDTVKIHVLGEGEQGYKVLTSPGIEIFHLTSYETLNAYYFMTSDQRDIGRTGDTTLFDPNASTYGLSMYPSEQIKVSYEILSYEKDVSVEFTSSNSRVATVTQDGVITVLRQGNARIAVNAKVGDRVFASAFIRINVKESYERNGPFLTGYRGNGTIDENGEPTGIVNIGEDLGAGSGLTTIEQFAFSHYDFVPKGPDDIIDEEDPYHSKIWYVGENDHIKEVIIPKGVTDINMYAFAGMEGLEKVKLPSTLKHIGVGAFLDCKNLREVDGLQYVQLINQDAFRNTGLYKADLSNVIAIGNYAFAGTKLAGALKLPASAQSIGAYAFSGIDDLNILEIGASNVKFGEGAFANDRSLKDIPVINAANIPEGLFEGDTMLTAVTVGRDVESIDRDAFRGTGVTTFKVAAGNKNFSASEDGKVLYRVGSGDTEILCVAPKYSNTNNVFSDPNATKVGAGAFSGTLFQTISLPAVTEIGENAFFDCTNLRTVTLGDVENIPDYAFFGTRLNAFQFGSVKTIGAYAFYGCSLSSVTLPENVTVGAYAFSGNRLLGNITVGSGSKIEDHAFASTAQLGSLRSYNVSTGSGTVVMEELGYVCGQSNLASVTVGDNVEIGNFAFAYNPNLRRASLGDGVTVGDSAFFLCLSLSEADLHGVTSIGDYAFAGETTQLVEYTDEGVDVWGEDHEVRSNSLVEVDLSSLTSIGSYAFAWNTALTTVTLGEGLKEIAPYAFYSTRIGNIGLGNVERIGDHAFAAFSTLTFFVGEEEQTYSARMTEVDLSGLKKDPDDTNKNIGAHAFEGAASLVRVTLPNDTNSEAEIGDFAFAGCTSLATVDNLTFVPYIGAHAFENANISGEIDLAHAAYIGDLAFANNHINKATLGTVLEEIGDNPFAGDPIRAFGTTTPVYFPSTSTDPDDIVGETFDGTFDIGEKISVIDGVLYRKVEFAGGDLRGERVVNGVKEYYLYGLELITYPAENDARKEYTVAEGTVRIGAGAFMGTKTLERVILPASLASIGDKAFYGANALKIVVFNSLKAPILEEQYDEDYQISQGDDSNLPGEFLQNAENDETARDLGVLKYGMWFIDPASFFYGANFVDYIGKTDGSLTMVRPSNGTGYDNFIYGQYFDLILSGPVAADETTRAVIRAINALPDAEDITAENYLNYKPQADAARALYEAITSDEQRALIGNYQRLRNVEEQIGQKELEASGGSVQPPEEDGGSKGPSATVVGPTVAVSVLVAVAIVVGAVFYVRKQNAKKKETVSGEDVPEDTDDEDTQSHE